MIKKVGERIRAIRLEKKLTQANMEEELDMKDSGGYAKIERAEVNVPLNRLFQIAAVLEVNITEFFEDKTSQAKEPKTNYGYATKEDIEHSTNEILKEIEKLRLEINASPKAVSKERFSKRKT